MQNHQNSSENISINQPVAYGNNEPSKMMSFTGFPTILPIKASSTTTMSKI
jgi:hypothetical protein